MIEFVRSRHVNATPEAIWPFVEDVTAWSRWFTDAGSEVVFFSPTREWQQTIAKIRKQREAVFA